MKQIRVRSLFALLTLSALAAPVRAAEIPTPESVLGFKVGADRKLADWAQIVDYFRKLDAAAERVKIDGEGKTTLGKPFLAVVITSEKNMGNLEAIRQANLRLSDPRGLSDEEASKLLLMQDEGAPDKNYYINEFGRMQVNAPWYGPEYHRLCTEIDWNDLEIR